jgi:hypothetical protein|tara:strand:+ start:268 stop:585 length:318 start_codon:yes stop_codon:yes gene_type:complete
MMKVSDVLEHKKQMIKNKQQEQTRPVHIIAAEIEDTWPKVNYAARPYLDAMHELININDHYAMDRGTHIVAYFLSNASTWRGDDARRIKKELKAMMIVATDPRYI